MRLKAIVRRETGATRHLYGVVEDGAIVATVPVPTIAWVEIEHDASGWFLLYNGVDGACVADTWHETETLAKDAARAEFEIADADWVPADPR